MDYKVATYLLYLPISVALTVWVAQTLFRNGRVFLVDVFDGDQGIADSVNHLLVVGFYLVNLGYVTLALKVTGGISTMTGSIEALSLKIGFVLLVLGAMHFLNLYVFTRIRRYTHRVAGALPPLPPDDCWAPPQGA